MDPIKEDKEIAPAGTMASVLVTLAAISLAVVGFPDTGIRIDTLFSFIGFLSILGSALILDAIMDKIGVDSSRRWYDMNFGFLIFAVVIAVMCASIQVMLLLKGEIPSDSRLWIFTLVAIFVNSFLVFLKLMQKDEWYNLTTISLLPTSCFTMGILIWSSGVWSI